MGIAVAALIGSLFGGNASKAPRAASTSTATTEIRRQDLVEVDEEDGTLGYSDERAVVNRLSGTVTALPRAGAVVRPDHTLFRVDKTPVILMDGSAPAYRTLSAGVSAGVDVEELERNLRALGYDSGAAISVDRHWTAATTAAVERWQAAHGFATSGSVALGRVVFQPGTRRVSTVDATLGGDAGSSQGSGSSGAAGTNGARYDGSAAKLRFASYTTTTPTTTTPTTTTPTTTTPTTTTPTTTTPEAKKRKTKKKSKKQKGTSQQKDETTAGQTNSTPSSGSGSSAAGTASSASGGAGSSAQESSPAATVLKTTSTRSQVAVELDTAKQSLAKRGARVTVDLPSGQGVRGTIVSVGRVATKSDSSSSTQGSGTGGASGSSSTAATIPVRIRIFGVTALDQAPATVHFEKSRRKNVLTIPVTALLARAGGRFAVEVRTGDSRRLVEVSPGLYTSGYVEIDGRGLEPGMKVTDARV